MPKFSQNLHEYKIGSIFTKEYFKYFQFNPKV